MKSGNVTGIYVECYQNFLQCTTEIVISPNPEENSPSLSPFSGACAGMDKFV